MDFASAPRGLLRGWSLGGRGIEYEYTLRLFDLRRRGLDAEGENNCTCSCNGKGINKESIFQIS